MSPGGSQASAGEGLSPCNIGIGIGKMEIDFLTACEARIRRGDRTTTFSPHFKFIHIKAPSTIRWYRKKMTDKKTRLLSYVRDEIDKLNTKYRNDELNAELLGIYIRSFKCVASSCPRLTPFSEFKRDVFYLFESIKWRYHITLYLKFVKVKEGLLMMIHTRVLISTH